MLAKEIKQRENGGEDFQAFIAARASAEVLLGLDIPSRLDPPS